MKKLNRREALIHIRQVFEDMALGRTYVPGGIMCGMCHQAHRLWLDERITERVFRRLEEDIVSMRPDIQHNYGYFWPTTVSGAKERVKAITKYLKTVK